MPVAKATPIATTVMVIAAASSHELAASRHGRAEQPGQPDRGGRPRPQARGAEQAGRLQIHGQQQRSEGGGEHGQPAQRSVGRYLDRAMDDDRGDEHGEALHGVEAAELRHVDRKRRDPEQDGADPGRPRAGLVTQPDEHCRHQERGGDQRGNPRRGQAVAEQREALGHQPGVQEDPVVKALGDTWLARRQQPLGGQDVMELVWMGHSAEIDAVE